MRSHPYVKPSTSQVRRTCVRTLARKPVNTTRRQRSVLAQAGEGGGNPFGNMGNFMKQLKQAQEVMQVEAVKVQKELAEAEFEGFSSDETVRVVMSGQQEAKGCDITQAAYSQGAEALGVLVTEAYKDAHEKSMNAMKDRMKNLASSLGLPQNPNM